MASETHARTPEIGTLADDPDLPGRLEKIWKTKPGLYGKISTVDHKEIGKRYLMTAFAFLILGGLEALVMRIQLAQPGMEVLTPEQYNELFSMHGITMIFLYALPVLSGFSNYLFPLLLGARDMAFPRMNAFSYWVYLASGIFLYGSFFAGAVPNNGWFNYAPLSLKQFNPGLNMDFYALGMVFLGISTTAGAANFVVTAMRMRAPGMTLNRLPVMIWSTTTISVGILLAVPAVSLAFFLLWLDRQFGTHFYSGGLGEPLLWQHLFWIFAHPWVYIIVLPAMGMVSIGLPVFCRRPLVGYTLVILGTILTMVLGFGVWVHHMFTTGIPYLALSFFGGASFVITIPSAVAVFAWIGTIWLGRPVITVPFLYFAAFISMFVIGGVSGVMTAAVPSDLQLHDTYFVVAHIHYVLIGINLFGVLGGIYYWFPKMTGHLLSERLGRWNFWTTLFGFNLAFLPMHWTGLLGMPRRIFTYEDGLGWNTVNLITTVGAFVLAVGILLFLINVVMSRKSGAKAGPNPWDGSSLEWAVSSPPPPYNFALNPTIGSRHPLWEGRLQETTGQTSISRGLKLDRGKEALATTVLDADPVAILKMPEDSPWPFITTLAMSAGFTGLLLHWWWLSAASWIAVAIALLIWLWPSAKLDETARPAHA